MTTVFPDNLPENWDSYGNGPPYKVVLDVARLIVFLMSQKGFGSPDVWPVSSGGVIIVYRDDQRELGIDLDGVDGVSFSYTVKNLIVDEGDIHVLQNLLERIKPI